MVEKAIDWLTRVVTGDEAISRITVMVISVGFIIVSYFYITKDRSNTAGVLIGDVANQINPNDL